MAIMEIVSTNCGFKGCEQRATRRVLTQEGSVVGEYCVTHANRMLLATAKAEGSKARQDK